MIQRPSEETDTASSKVLAHFEDFACLSAGEIEIATILIAMKVPWELRKHIWFWLTMLCIVVAHVPLVIQLLLSKEVRSPTKFSPYPQPHANLLWTDVSVGSP